MFSVNGILSEAIILNNIMHTCACMHGAKGIFQDHLASYYNNYRTYSTFELTLLDLPSWLAKSGFFDYNVMLRIIISVLRK